MRGNTTSTIYIVDDTWFRLMCSKYFQLKSCIIEIDEEGLEE